MSTDGRQERTDLGGMTRRELVSALARWTVPTVLTLSLGVRSAYAAASCPPCTKKISGKCRACTVSQILNCQCEPCLGPPYCASGITAQPGWAPPALSRSQSGPSEDVLNALRRRRALTRQDDPFAAPFTRRRLGAPADSIFGPTPRSPTARGLYDRLRRPEDRR